MKHHLTGSDLRSYFQKAWGMLYINARSFIERWKLRIGRKLNTEKETLSKGVILFFIVSTQLSWANGFRNPPEGATGVGRIGGKIADVDDPSAISLNPANLTEIQKPAALAAITALYADATFRSATGQTTTTKQPLKALPNLYGAWPLQDGKYVLGLGITTPFGQSTIWGKNSIFRFPIPWYAALTVIDINPTFAAKLTDTLSVGVGADVFLSRLDSRQFFNWTTLTGDPSDSNGDARFLADGTGFGGNLGITWKFAERQKLAVTYRSAIDVEYDGTFHLTNVPPPVKLPAAFQGVTSASGYHAGIMFPSIVTIGYGIQATDTLRLGADIEWVQFSTHHTLRSDIENDNVLQTSTSTHESWRDIWTIGWGADWKFRKGWILRWGYQYLQSPIPDKTFSPTLPDANKHLASVGIGYTYKQHTFEASYAETFAEQRTIGNNETTAFNGTYNLNSHMMALSYRYSF